jgi:putative endonuclease
MTSGPVANTRDSGALWEDAALHHLTRNGLELVTRNFACRFGEIDLVLRERGQLVFAEVRYRGDAAHGGGTVSVGPAKREKLIRTASVYLQSHPQFAALPCRFDVIGCGGSLAQPVFEWTRGAVEAL